MSVCENRPEVTLMVSLRELRAERLLSIRELARRASIAPSTIFLIEAGRTVPRQRVARQIAEVLGVDPMTVDELRRHIEAAKLPRTDSQGSPGACPTMDQHT
jgi:DNA-binding XRE family transcriptional regulator